MSPFKMGKYVIQIGISLVKCKFAKKKPPMKKPPVKKHTGTKTSEGYESYVRGYFLLEMKVRESATFWRNLS